MLVAEAPDILNRLIETRVGNTSNLDALVAVDVMANWYAADRAADALPLIDDGDMLLFEWGTHDWGNGPSFQYKLTRQFIAADEDDDDAAIWQISVILHFPSGNGPGESGQQWCFQPGEVDALRQFVEGSGATAAVRRLSPTRVEVKFGQVG